MAAAMATPPSQALTTAITVLDYMAVPAAGFYFLGSMTFGFCILQKPSDLSSKRKRLPITLLCLLVLSYVAEVLYYLSRVLAEDRFSAPQHTVIHALASMLCWTSISAMLYNATKVLWYPYFGSFVILASFEVTLCALSGVLITPENRLDSVALSIRAFRASISLLLVLDGFVIFWRKQGEKATDEETQSLLKKPANGTTNGVVDGNGYGTLPGEPSDTSSEDDEDESHDRDKEIKEQQRKRLEEQGGWVGYLKGFLIFLPYLFPRNNWKIMLCMGIRGFQVIQGRILNLLAPRELGIITSKLAAGTTVMPWANIGLWAFYQWFNSFCGFGVIDSVATHYVEQYANQRISTLAFDHCMSLSMDFHTKKDSGEVLTAVKQAKALNQLIEMALFEVAPVAFDLIIAMWYVTTLFDAYMAFMILCMGVLYIWLGIVFTTWSQSKRRKYAETHRTEETIVYESISNWQTVSYFNRLSHESERYKNSMLDAISAWFGYMFRSYGGHAVQDAVTNFGYVGIFILAVYQIVYYNKPVGNLVTLMMYWSTLMSPLWVLGYSYRHISSSLIDAERLLQLLNTKASVADTEGARDLAIKECKVEFKNVEFHYDPRKSIIKDASFVAQPGQTVAFVGETGGGKSTLFKLLARFYDVTGGSVQIDGQDLRSITQSSLKETLGIVPQEVALFNRSIMENVRYARLDATDEEVMEACKAAAIHDKIMSFPDGYKSKVGERGVKLSGGENQRVAIARVLLRRPKIVMLDEATSAIDSSTEKEIQQAFQKLSTGRTTFVIAHRLSTIVDADQILVVDQGKIVERGKHSELLAQEGRYAELWNKQTSGTHSKPASTKGEDEVKKVEPLIDLTPENEGQEDVGDATGRSDKDDAGGAERRK